LRLLVDSIGIKMLGEGEWKTKKHGADYRRQWRKVHLGIDATTLEIRAIEMTDNGTGDAPILPCLLDQTGNDEPIASISGDGAYDTKGCHATARLQNCRYVPPSSTASRGWIAHDGRQAIIPSGIWRLTCPADLCNKAATQDAHSLYRKVGFEVVEGSGKLMRRIRK
jgi:hypothetical protein